MVITNLIGGLGNQMFQYAAGLALAKSKGESLRLDIGDFANYRLHNGFELARIFVGPFVLAQASDINQVLGWRSWSFMRRLLRRQRLEFARGTRFFVEPHFHYSEDLFGLPNDCYMVGYWQSERYFEDVEHDVRQAFRFKDSLSGKNSELATRISEGNSVSLHIRRGDYASDPKTNAVHGVVPISYYVTAASYIASLVNNPHFFVFSDDTEWARKSVQISFPCEFVDHNRGANSYRDMQLMSICKHHILANSTFSWWAAWLNSKPGKIVLYPRRWFRHSELNTKDLFPNEWIGIEV